MKRRAWVVEIWRGGRARRTERVAFGRPHEVEVGNAAQAADALVAAQREYQGEVFGVRRMASHFGAIVREVSTVHANGGLAVKFTNAAGEWYELRLRVRGLPACFRLAD